MRDIIEMWKDTRMVVLTAVSAAVYAATIMPLKVIPIIPGFTEVRPGVVFAIFCSFLFGPAGAWGAAFGNLIADFFGTLTLGSFFGFFGNFLFGYIPYKMFRAISTDMPLPKSKMQNLGIFSSILGSAAACTLVIAWGVDAIGAVPFKILAPIIMANNTFLSLIFVPILLATLYPRVRTWGLVYSLILPAELLRPGRFAKLGTILVLIGSFGGLILGLVLGFAGIVLPVSTAIALLPAMIVLLIGAMLL